MVGQFSRHIEKELIDKLMASDLWTKKLKTDCENRDVFLAIRPGYISFYHKGGGLFRFDEKGFQTHVSYSVVLDKTDLKKTYISENYLTNVEIIKTFNEGYDSIKKNCKRFSENTEAEGVSGTYHKFPYNLKEGNVVVLDIEVAFIDTSEEERRQNRIDILLFNKETKELRFIEAKLFGNDEIRSKYPPPPIIEQLERYRKMIDEQRKDILPAYQEYTNTLNKIFSGLSLPEPQKINDSVGLLIFGFDQDQKDGKLKKQIIDNPVFKDIPFYPIGDIKDITAENLWKKTN